MSRLQISNITWATFDNPPINLVDYKLISDLHDFLTWLQPAVNKTTPKAVIFNSANPEFYLGHFDLHNIAKPFTDTKTAVFNQLVECTRFLLNTTSTAFVAEINGRVIGAGHELIIQMDMRFAGPKARASSFENALGLTAAAGGQPFLGHTVGRARAMEYLLAAQEFDGPTGAALGLFNSFHPTDEQLRAKVNDLASRIGMFPQHSLNDTKFTFASLNPSITALDEQLERFVPLENMGSEQEIIQNILAASQNQTMCDFELDIPNSVVQTLWSR
ncbi:uncharacterized protein K452DRAFT_323143 [Aplosporella prunicola CBS 121167]|uniref:Enoyl-CoA hydratase n=1 Tax=Aplosporella prunicola CBS 121167 TaxID=1176127 RepID=A0A6A6AWF4_9PEZI|nr:uncharacterized protein K452DRAFT_323143 [Aplosporella prunicola CBS 121167]KAF2135274.1 hypothetical protein K452DRAFT_323143 [Aplosporella prunicola CBS 121167]